MAQIQNEKEVLLCTYKECKRIQSEDGEFCELHYPATIEKMEKFIEALAELRQSFCEVENKSWGKSILAIDRIDQLSEELKKLI